MYVIAIDISIVISYWVNNGKVKCLKNIYNENLRYEHN